MITCFWQCFHFYYSSFQHNLFLRHTYVMFTYNRILQTKYFNICTGLFKTHQYNDYTAFIFCSRRNSHNDNKIYVIQWLLNQHQMTSERATKNNHNKHLPAGSSESFNLLASWTSSTVTGCVINLLEVDLSVFLLPYFGTSTAPVNPTKKSYNLNWEHNK